LSEPKTENVPSTETALPSWITEIPKALVPSSLKALDRLLGAAVDYPVALIRRETAKIESQTKAFEIVESAIAKSAGEIAGADIPTIDRALKVLVRKEYRKQSNREAVAAEALHELKSDTISSDNEKTTPALDEDWLNVFERFAEDASTDRMQGLWGRVLAGEIRRPGRFSLRTLRFLSEFSQSDAVLFAEVANIAIGEMLLKSLILPEGTKDIRHLMQLEAAGLMTDSTGLGLTLSLTFDPTGHVMINDGELCLVFRGEANTTITISCLSLTPLGVEVLSLVPNRDVRNAMRRVANEVKSAQIKAAFIGHRADHNRVGFIEQLWLEETP
jgi:hypothetical protein